MFCLKKFNIINVDKNHHKKLTNYKNVSITKKNFLNKVRYKYLVQELEYFFYKVRLYKKESKSMNYLKTVVKFEIY